MAQKPGDIPENTTVTAAERKKRQVEGARKRRAEDQQLKFKKKADYDAFVRTGKLPAYLSNQKKPTPAKAGGSVGPVRAAPRAPVPAAADPTVGLDAAIAAQPGGGIDIRAVQQQLVDAGYKIKVDGIWGPKSKAAWTKFTSGGGSMSGGRKIGASAPGAPSPGDSAPPGASSIEGDGVAPTPPVIGATSETDLKLEVQRSYGYLAAYFDHQEIGPILKLAAEGGWDEARLMGALFKTNWWQQTSATARQFDAQKATDPAEVQRKVDQTGRLVGSLAGRVGLVLTPQRVTEIATTYNRLGWDENDLQAALGNEFSYTPGQPYSGDMGKAVSRFKELASQYMVPVDEQTAHNFAKKWMTGEADEDNTEQYLRTQAISRFPQLKQYIDAGINPYDFFSPYRQEIGRMLGTSADQIDLVSDPKWSKIIDNVDGKGNRRPMTISEAQVYVRGLDEWRGSDEANKRVADVTQFLGERMGVR